MGITVTMTDRVMVFASAPILTVTIEQQTSGAELHVHPGGQGVWQARMIAALGVPVTLCAALGGETGDVLARQLEAEDGIDLRTVPRASGSGWYVHDRREGNRAEIAEHLGTPLDRHDRDELYTLALTEGLRSPVAVLSGPQRPEVVDADVYRRLAADLTANGVRVVADLSGDHLSVVIEGGIAFVKVSHEQLIDDGRAADDSVPEEAVRMGAAAGALNITRHGLGTGRAEAVQELYGRVRLA